MDLTNMAFSTNFAVNFVVFIFVIVCVQRQTYASKEDVYTIAASPLSASEDLSVIDFGSYDNHRSKRQVPGSGAQTTTAAPDVQGTTPAPLPVTTPTPAPNGPPTTPFSWDNTAHMFDDHVYYRSETSRNMLDSLWVDITAEKHEILSDSHRTAVTQDLPFNFPFYGHNIAKITIATGGFLYMSPFIHQWLTATQYIAPLMANFDTTLGNKSEVLVMPVGEDKFVVEWRNVHLQDQNTTETFQFQAILHQNGSIFFLYKKLPIPIVNISSKSHPVKIGLSDAFYFDTVSLGAKRRTIYEYHRVTLNTTIIEEGTVVMVHPKPTCNVIDNCENCVTAAIGFECKWCGIINRCSDSVDWHRQKWIDAGCVDLAGSSNCSLIATAATPQAQKSNNGATIGVAIVIALVVLVLIGAVGGWFYYAYSHPTSSSGMWLMEHRPSQMKAKLNTMKFWKKNESSADKYAVESTA